jgi:RimJ/RimL family protein N-acetyltransferase
VIETLTLRLRAYTRRDADALSRVLCDGETMRFWPRPFTRDEVAAWVEQSIASYAAHGFGRYALVLKAENRLIGDCGILRMAVDGEEANDLGCIIPRAYQGRGLAAEAATALVRHAFKTVGLDSLHANVPADHVASQKVAEKIGMTRVKIFANPRNRNLPTYLYVLRRPSA